MRTGNIILGLIALLSAFVQAPFDHIHPEDLDHPATSGPVHFHVLDPSLQSQPYISAHTADDDEVDVPWTLTTSTHVVTYADAELGEKITLPEIAITSAVVSITRHRGHDPPEFSPKIPRAPPA